MMWSDRKTEEIHAIYEKGTHIFRKGREEEKSLMNEVREVRRIGEPKLCHKVNTDNRGINDPCGQVLMKWV